MSILFLIKLAIIFLVSGCISVFSVPLIIKFGVKKNIIDIPNQRKSHTVPIVRIGGIAIGLAFLISITFSFCLGWFDPNSLSFVRVAIPASFLFLFIGLADDVISVSPFIRLILQIVVSMLVWHLGIRIDFIDLSWIVKDLYFTIPDILSLCLTVFWISAITNAFNWLDGLDGLAAGTCIVNAIGFSAIMLNYQTTSNVFLMAALIGSCIGFLYYNFYSAKIYMGDCGSYFIGFLLAVIAINTSFTSNITIQESRGLFILIPFIVLFLPIADMLFVIFRRLLAGKSPFYPDRNHFHHRLMGAGFNHKDSVLFGYVVNQYFVGISLAIVFFPFRYLIFSFSNIILILFFIKKCRIEISRPLNISIRSKN